MRPKHTKKPYKLWRMDWDESEADWGVRPDGHSLHLTEEDYKSYMKRYCAGLPKEVPHEYSRPGGSLRRCTIRLTKADHNLLVKNKGLRVTKW